MIDIQKYGDQLTFVEGLKARVLENNDRAFIKKEIISYVDGMKARQARLAFASDHSVSPMVRYDTYSYALDIFRAHMCY